MAIDTSAPGVDSATAAPPQAGGPGEDLSALSWVQDELRRSLDQAHKALRRYLKEQAQRGDLDSVDPAVLRQARNQLHQCVGVLELVGLGPAAELPRAAEAALQRISARPKLVTPAAVAAVEQGSFALLDFIGRRLAGKPVSALALFPQYKALQDLAGALRVHPADLWDLPWAWRDLALDTSVPPRHPDAGTTAQIEADLLALMRGAPASVSARMSTMFAGLALGAQAAADSADASAHAPHDRLATLWQLAAAFFEAQADGLLEADAYSKRLGSKLLSQLRAGELAEPSERLAHDLLFFCHQAGVSLGGARRPGVRLAAVRQGYALAGRVAIDYARPSLGRHDPAWVAQARKRAAGAKEVWSAVCGGDTARFDSLAEQFALVGDSVTRLYDDGAALARALQDTATQAVAAGTEPAPALAMEVATALLYLDASVEDADFDHADSGQRVRRLAERIDAVRQGQDPGTLELWMEELYRRVSDRQTIGSVVQELRTALSEVEKNIDQYFRNPAQRTVLIPVPGQLQAMRGVLSVLGLEQASLAVLRMRDDVDALASTEVDPQHALASGSFERLADNLGALSFLIDMVSVQPQMAKSLFQFDAETGNLRAVMAREDRPSGFDEMDTLSGAHDRETDVRAVSLAFDRLATQALHPPGVGNQGLPTLALDGLSGFDLLPAETTGVPATTGRPAAAGVDPRDLDLPPLPTGGLDGGAARPAAPTAASAADQTSGLEDDPEMREIFLEEAAEVLDGARAALAVLHAQPGDADAMTTVRRAFHTLKGSARMVGLRPFGEAAWACEQLYNTRLASHAGADADLLDFSHEACTLFGQWVQALEAGTAGGHGPDAIVRAADALRTEGRRVPLLAPAAAAPSAAEPAEAADSARSPLDDLPVARDDLALDLRQRVPGLPLAADLDLAAPAPGQAGTGAEPLPAIDFGDLDELGHPGDLAAAERTLFDLPPAPEPAQAPPVPEVVELDLDADFGAGFDLPAGVPDVGPDRPAAAGRADQAAAAPDAEPTAMAPEAEAFRQVGPLRISIPLFNIYLNEADELSRRLGTALAEWALEQQRPVGDATVALAHSLAGSSGTVGFADLSQLARALEHALERSQARGQGQPGEANLFAQAADEIRRLLHLFAAGFLQAPDADLLDRLQQLAPRRAGALAGG